MAAASTSTALYATVTSATLQRNVPEDTQELKHHAKDGKTFFNPWPSYHEHSVPQIMGGLLWRRLKGQQNHPDTTPPTVPVHKPSFLPTRDTNHLRATWLGHACYYVEFPGGLRVLFDPVFTPRCSPFSFTGPKRYTEAPCQIKDIPIIDAVVISHAHYDHLSLPDMLEVKNHHPRAHFFAPLGNKKWFEQQGITNVTELDWWQSRSITLRSKSGSVDATSENGATAREEEDPTQISATIECLPCQHQANRGLFDRNQTLWASWLIESGDKKLWFAGDTGYRSVPELPPEEDDYGPDHKYPHCPAFEEIGKHRGPFDLGLIPIGAYLPRFIMSSFHANPFDSANIFVDSQCKRALAMHWGTWVLTEEDVLEPPKLLKQALANKGIPETGVFDICDIGESREF